MKRPRIMLHPMRVHRAVTHSLVLAAVFLSCLALPRAFAALSCSVTTTCTAPNVVMLRISSTTNAHAELPSQSNYPQLVCCGGEPGLSNSCSGTTGTPLKLSSTTNAHVEEDGLLNYTENACISMPTGSVSVAYQSNNCNGFDTTFASISSSSNAHVGEPAAYPLKVCVTTVVPQSLTFSISDSSIGFGSLTPSGAKFATGDTFGSESEVEAHTLSVTTNAANGYALMISGSTLAMGTSTISAIGASNTASSPGTEQFGLRVVASGGTGVVSAPYEASGFAYAATATTSSQVASASTGDAVTTTYSARYLSNVAPLTRAGSYSTILTYTVTGNF